MQVDVGVGVMMQAEAASMSLRCWWTSALASELSVALQKHRT